MKQPISVFDKAGDICKAMKPGILLTSGTLEHPNTMTISWGLIGVEWRKPIFLAVVRLSRYTHQLLDQYGDFTVNIPWGEFDSKILSYCGAKSGRDVDKFAELGLTAVASEKVKAPAIKEFPLTLECRIVAQQLQKLDDDVEEAIAHYYTPDENGEQDFHVMYFGEIVDAYLITDED